MLWVHPSTYLVYTLIIQCRVLSSSIYDPLMAFHFHMLQAHIERALNDHFLFRKLTDSQCHVLLDCMQRVEVHPGDVIVKQVCCISTKKLKYYNSSAFT